MEPVRTLVEVTPRVVPSWSRARLGLALVAAGAAGAALTAAAGAVAAAWHLGAEKPADAAPGQDEPRSSAGRSSRQR